MADESDQTCPNCGSPIPSEVRQHAGSLVGESVVCPTCGASVSLAQDDGPGDATAGDVERAEAAPPGRHEDHATFSGEETIAEVAEELREKPS